LDEVVEMDESKFIPKIENYSLKIITTLREIDELIKGGFDFSLYPEIEDEKQRLSRGAILFCVFVEKDFAHRSWIAMSEENQRDIDPVPYAVDYQGEEVSVGYARTSPKYRGVGIYTYVYYQIYQFLKRKGISKVRFSINKDNIAPQKAQAKLGSEIIAEWRSLKLLWWKFWKEKTKDI
jgi:GNAT superfamily N-acetyltransferase